MNTQDEIDAFAEASDTPVKTAHEYARRRRKGLPSDRWADGHTGAELVADGIEAQAAIINMYADALLTLLAEKQDAGRLFTSHSKYAQKDEADA